MPLYFQTEAGAIYGYASRLRTRVIAGAERETWRSGSCSGKEFASCMIVARLRFLCRRAGSLFPDASSMSAAVACTGQAAPAQLSQRIEHRSVGFLASIPFDALTMGDVNGPLTHRDLALEFLGQRSLADARFPGNKDDL